MPLIEGIGNEVVHFAAVVVLAAVAALAWWSTNARPDRYRIVLAMRHHTPPQAVSLRIRTGAPQPSVIYMNRLSNASWLHTPESVSRGGVRNSFSDALVPLQEMDSMVDADMALLENNRLRFYRGVQPARVVLNTSEASTEESESQEESEPASNAQIREMDSIVSAMEADVSTGCEVFNRPNENNSNSDAPLITRVKKEKKESAPNTNDSSQESEPTIGDEANNAVVHVNDRKILIKLKYLNDTLKEVEGSLDELLKDFKWRHFSRELTSECRVRLIYNGRVLGDDSATLRALGLRDRSVVHCLVHPQSRTEERTPVTNGPTVEATGERADRHWDLENILMTLVSVALTVVWFFRCEYSNMFTASASVALFGLTVFYSVAIFGLYLSDTFHFDRRQPQPVPNN